MNTNVIQAVFANVPAEMVTEAAYAVKRQREFLADEIEMMRSHFGAFGGIMSTAECIDHYSRIVGSGRATEAEELALLDLLNPFSV